MCTGQRLVDPRLEPGTYSTKMTSSIGEQASENRKTPIGQASITSGFSNQVKHPFMMLSFELVIRSDMAFTSYPTCLAAHLNGCQPPEQLSCKLTEHSFSHASVVVHTDLFSTQYTQHHFKVQTPSHTSTRLSTTPESSNLTRHTNPARKQPQIWPRNTDSRPSNPSPNSTMETRLRLRLRESKVERFF